jgi:hypothetical protein
MFNCYLFANHPIGAGPWERIRAVPAIRDFLQIEGLASLPDLAINLRMTEADIERGRCRQFNRQPACEIGERVLITQAVLRIGRQDQINARRSG